ncbi:MAG: hypothetical protein U1F09_15915 [Steroidobacteraceae bacterium]
MRRRSARIHLPPLSPGEALALVRVLERAVAAVWRAHGEQMRHELDVRTLEARARRHGVTSYDLDADPDADF